jgi:hypothetical protein
MAGLGNPKTGGRKKGTSNKLSSTVKDNVIAVFDRLGGIEHMAEWASDNPTQFYNIYSKLLPIEMHGAGDDGEHKIEFTWSVE